MSLLGASLLTGVLGTVWPTAHKKYLRLLSGICMIAILIAPLPSYLENAESLVTTWDENGNGGSEVAYDEIYYQSITAANAYQIEENTKNILIERFSFDEDDILVTVMIAEEEGRFLLKKAIVSLSGKAILTDPRRIAECVEELLECECEIAYG